MKSTDMVTLLLEVIISYQVMSHYIASHHLLLIFWAHTDSCDSVTGYSRCQYGRYFSLRLQNFSLVLTIKTRKQYKKNSYFIVEFWVPPRQHNGLLWALVHFHLMQGVHISQLHVIGFISSRQRRDHPNRVEDWTTCIHFHERKSNPSPAYPYRTANHVPSCEVYLWYHHHRGHKFNNICLHCIARSESWMSRYFSNKTQYTRVDRETFSKIVEQLDNNLFVFLFTHFLHLLLLSFT